jgi:hypothetical protein
MSRHEMNQPREVPTNLLPACAKGVNVIESAEGVDLMTVTNLQLAKNCVRNMEAVAAANIIVATRVRKVQLHFA